MSTESHGVITMRSLYVSPPDDAESLRRLAASGRAAAQCTNGGGDGDHDHVNEHSDVKQEHEGEEKYDALVPIQLPQSTHSLLFTEPVFSLPFAFAVAILFISFACLGLAFFNELGSIPFNVTRQVRFAQYLSILIALLMEEEIPTGLYLLRRITRQSLRQKFPQMMYRKFILSSCVRIFNGYFFLINVLSLLTRTTGVIEIFYDVLALQFVQQLDDIAFNLAKMDVLGKTLQRACTAKCFRAEFEKKRFGRTKHLNIFLKAIYFVNLCGMLGWMGYVTYRQTNGDFYDDSITVNFGNTVWNTAWVAGQDEPWTLVYSNFNGVYAKRTETHNNRPVYIEMAKLDQTPFVQTTPAEIKYCNEIEAWVFYHEDISKKKSPNKEGCNWLLRSPKTAEFDLLDVVGDWQVWTGVIEKAYVSIDSNICHDDSHCNLNGKCTDDGRCECDRENGAQFMGNHCEVKLRDSCQTIIGETYNESFSVVHWEDLLEDYSGPHDTIMQVYSRPIYVYNEGSPDLDNIQAAVNNITNTNDTMIELIYSGSRWFGMVVLAMNLTVEEQIEGAVDYHAFWSRAYSYSTIYVSEPTMGSIPVGVDFYVIGERGEQFGPFGALYPVQVHEQTGRGYFRCSDNDT